MHYKNIFLVLISILLCGCSSKFASSFGKRHYTKGFFWDKPGKSQAVASNPFVKKEDLSINLKKRISYEEPRAMCMDNKKVEAIPSASRSLSLVPTNSVISKQPIKADRIKETAEEPTSKDDSSQTKVGLVGFVFFCIALGSLLILIVLIELAPFGLEILLALGAILNDVLGCILSLVALGLKHDKYRGLATFVLLINLLVFVLYLLLVK